MRRVKRAPVEIFSLSFLDIISCAFGAVVLLVLLARNADVPSDASASEVTVRIEQLLAAQNRVADLSARLNNELETLDEAIAAASADETDAEALEQSIPRAQESIAQVRRQAQSLRNEIRFEQARLNVPSSADEPSPEAGGIPTDADYVIFVIDNSGSMSADQGWRQVTRVVEDIIASHPEMKGFQIMAADGSFMYSGQEGRWLPDTTTMRQRAIQGLAGFRGGASAPEVGILRAIELYKNEQDKVSLYVFGDDFRPGTLDQVVTEITQANMRPNGTARFRIHGIGFHRASYGNAAQFSAFMQAVAKRNRGAFVGLPN
ncbi:VWA domain-containing protein [Aliidiomarina shirensis]|uniref:VWA domain-containing protein n=1 Tax=Aliidiomarina shirensis TaxID=1048642 RepID=A0A432WSV6_9GAMM|nr:VWA domain-containing protein [Aliidiomarina shirensis]RUO36853.1 VWA domain-containing protein [Aliidiomarina shirensis]